VKALALLALLISTTAIAAPKKDDARAHKTKQHAVVVAAGTKAAHLVNLHNQWTDEWLAVDPLAKPDGATVDRFLRDHYTNRPHAGMEPRLVDILLAAAANFHSDTVQVVSGFRHPKYNLILRKKGHQVARDSQHTKGNACDFFIPGIPTRVLHAWAKAQKIGGVGLYLDSGFVHMDTGPVRYWSGE
jgi:uncharacterized protein YcbK (DUF882 family)